MRSQFSAERSPMDRYSIANSGSAHDEAQARFLPPLTAKPAGALSFPGEDGGQSLAAWARRDLEATLQLLADRAQYITGGSGAAIALRDGENIICRASSGPSAPEVGSYFQASSGLSGESVRTRKTLCCDDAATDPRVNQEGCRALGIASFAVLPLIRDGEVIGIFEIFANKPHAFGERDILALQRMGEMVNTALDQVSGSGFKSVPGPEAAGTSSEMQSMPVTTQAADLPADNQSEITETTDVLAEGIENEYHVLFGGPDRLPGASRDEGSLIPEAAESATRTLRGTLSVHTCTACGFPVSEGRTLCLDCEAATAKKLAPHGMGSGGAAPAFLAGLGSPSRPPGIGHWISTHRYLLGMIAVTLSTIIFLLTR